MLAYEAFLLRYYNTLSNFPFLSLTLQTLKALPGYTSGHCRRSQVAEYSTADLKVYQRQQTKLAQVTNPYL